MSATKPLTAMRGYLGANIRKRLNSDGTVMLPAITITRQTGSRAVTIGKLLVENQQSRVEEGEPKWQLFEKDLVNYVLRKSGLPESLSKYYPENPTPFVEDALEDIVGLHPSSYKINEWCHSTIIELCRKGHAIIIGRASNLLTRDLPNTLRVRFVGSLEVRAAHVMKIMNLSERDAYDHIRHEDTLRKRYARMNFKQSDVDNPQHYDLVLNTDRLSDQAIVEIITIALANKLD